VRAMIKTCDGPQIGANQVDLALKSRAQFVFWAAVNPLRCAVLASRKPGAYIPVRPFDACVSPLDAAGEPFCAFARDASAPASLRSSPDIHVRSFADVRLTLRRTESRWFAGPW
jgi:hypothetical protein